MQDKYKIDITTPQNPLRCHNLLTAVKKGKTELTPDFALSFLQSTNNRKNIADFLEFLNQHFDTDSHKYAVYKPYIMALICREQPDNSNQHVAEIALKYTNLLKADKTDRDFMVLLNKVNLPEQQAKEVQSMSAKLYKKIPTDISDVAEDVSQKIINEKKGYKEISEFILEELPEKPTKRNIFSRLLNKIKER